jgi:hypothetical protein
MAATHVVIYYHGDECCRPLVQTAGDAQHMKIVTVGSPEGERVVFHGEFFSQVEFERLRRKQEEQATQRARPLPDSLDR